MQDIDWRNAWCSPVGIKTAIEANGDGSRAIGGDICVHVDGFRIL